MSRLRLSGLFPCPGNVHVPVESVQVASFLGCVLSRVRPVQVRSVQVVSVQVVSCLGYVYPGCVLTP